MSTDALDPARSAYIAATDAFLELAGRIPLDRYDGPGLGDWSLRSLVGHAARSLVTVATYLGTRADGIAAGSPGEYFVVVREVAGADPQAVHQRGVDAGLTLGDDPVGSLASSRAAAEAALDALRGQDVVIDTIAGGMRLSDYLPTRTFELTVHCLDIAGAVGLDFEPPAEALAETLLVAAGSALDLGFGVDVVLALTGRRPLPEGRSVVP